MTVLREDLLAGRTIALGGGVSHELTDLLSLLGASLLVPAEPGTPRGSPQIDAIVHEASAAFAGGGEHGLTAVLQDAWDTVGRIAAASLIPAQRPAKVVLIAPRANAARFAEPARAGLENLARTLSVEWARYGITTSAITPGARTSPADVAELVAFLLSPAGDYFSGCRFDLDAVEPK